MELEQNDSLIQSKIEMFRGNSKSKSRRGGRSGQATFRANLDPDESLYFSKGRCHEASDLKKQSMVAKQQMFKCFSPP